MRIVPVRSVSPDDLANAYSSEGERLRAVLRGKRFSEDDADDVLQTALVRGLERLRKGPRADADPRRWYSVLVRSTAKDWLKKKSANPVVYGEDTSMHEAELLDDFQLEDEADENFAFLIDQMPEHADFLKAKRDGKSQAAIGEELGMSQANVSRLEKKVFTEARALLN
jgi:RNA polymerase sigma factor (sigma-70 family)